MSFKLYDCAPATAAAVCFARITFSFCESQVAECGHDLVGGRASICEEPAEGLAKAMRPTIGRQPGPAARSWFGQLHANPSGQSASRSQRTTQAIAGPVSPR